MCLIHYSSFDLKSFAKIINLIAEAEWAVEVRYQRVYFGFAVVPA